MEADAFDDVLAMVHNLNIAYEDRVNKRIKAEWDNPNNLGTLFIKTTCS